MRYVPSIIPDGLSRKVKAWLADELQRLAAALGSVDNLALEPQNNAPARLADGQIVYADGTDFDPGNGEGIYARINSTWVDIGQQAPDLSGFTQNAEQELITGLWNFSTFDLLVGSGLSVQGAATDQGQVGQFGFIDILSGQARFGSYDWDAAAWQPVLLTGSDIEIEATAGNINCSSQLQVTSGKILRILNSGNTDHASFSHDGTDFNTPLVNTVDWNISGFTGAINIDANSVGPNFHVRGGNAGSDIARFERDVGGAAHMGLHATFGHPQIRFEASTKIWSIGLNTAADRIEIADSNSVGSSYALGIGVSGAVTIPSAQDASLISTIHPFQIGPTAGNNMRIDGNEILAVSNGSASDLHLNTEGGDVRIGTAGGSGSIFLRERTAATTDAAAMGQIWVKTATPNQLWFTDDAGNDTQIA